MRTFVAAVRDKYEYKKSEDGASAAGDYGVVGAGLAGKKQALDVLKMVYLPDSGIDSPGEAGEVASTCGAIAELDLAGNAFDSWPPLLAITSQLTKLHWLGLDRMPLAPLAALPDGFGAAAGGLRTLSVSSTGMAWEQLLLLSGAMPVLEEVRFSSNNVTTLMVGGSSTLPAGALAKVHSLYLEGNMLSSWNDVQPLGTLPALALLNLNLNQLRAVPKPSAAAADGSPPPFGSLRQLMLKGNQIDAWATVDALDAYPSLVEARLTELPLTSSMSGAAARRVVIARMAKLRSLNGSEVRTREREDAERFYLRQVAQEYPEGGLPDGAVVYPQAEGDGAVDISDDAPAAPKVDEYGRPLAADAPAGGATARAAPPVLTVPEGEEWSALTTRHPRWAALLVLHGTHVTRTVTQASGGVIANELMELHMRATSAEAAHLPTVTRKLPGGLPLKSIKLIACQLFKVASP